MRAVHTLESVLRSFVESNNFEWPAKATIEPPKDKKFGDLAANLAMVLAGQAKQKPRDLSERIREHCLAASKDIQAVEIAGPGFLNVTFSPDFWRATVAETLQEKENYGRTNTGEGRKVQVEYVSANPTGPLHIGHGRGAAVGDSLARILRFTGHEVETEYYLNDAGRQMRLLGLAVYVRAQQQQGQDVELPEECYKGDYIKDIAADVLAAWPDLLQLGEEEAVALCRGAAVADILAGIKTDLEAFGVEHQVWFSEKSLVDSGAVDKTFAYLQENGLAYEKDGAYWFAAEKMGDDKDRVLRKSDGSLTYFASDIAYHDDKYRRGFDLVVDIWGADHHGYVPRMTAAVEALGLQRDQFHVILVQLVNLLRGGKQIAMSTRAGQFETLADVVQEVGKDAARFIFLSRKSDSKLDFDLELVKQRTMDNPVYYVQYAHARIHSVLRTAAERGVHVTAAPTPENLTGLDTDEDLELLRLLERFPDTAAAAAANLSPHLVSFYLLDLAAALHRYYTKHHVLASEDPALVQARLLLLTAVAQVISSGLGLLGVSAPEQM